MKHLSRVFTFLLFILRLNSAISSLLSKATNCITSEAALKAAVQSAASNKAGRDATIINLCASRITITDEARLGLNVTNKKIILNCTLPDTKTKCTLDGKLNTRLFTGESTSLTVERIRFVNGYSNDRGGAFYFTTSSSININKGCVFSNNKADYKGGAIYISNSTLTVKGSGSLSSTTAVTFQNNTAYYGGAITADPGTLLTVTSTFFSGNRGETGAIYASQAKQVALYSSRFFSHQTTAVLVEFTSKTIIDKLTFDSNSAFECTGLYLYSFNDTTITNSYFTNNYAVDAGAGLCLYSGANASLVNVQFKNNTADNNGGGMWLSSVGNVSIKSSLFSGNLAAFGGGFYSGGSTLLLSQVRLQSNTGIESGSAINADSSDLRILNSDFYQNINAAAVSLNGGKQYIKGSRFIRNEMRAITNFNNEIDLYNSTFIPNSEDVSIPGYNMLLRGPSSVRCSFRTIFCGGYGLHMLAGTMTDCLEKGILGKIGVGSCKA